MPPMPYHFEKGPEFSVLESFLNGSQARAAQTLEKLRNGDPLWTLDFLEAESAQNPYSSITLGQHVYKDWFGWTGAGGNLPRLGHDRGPRRRGPRRNPLDTGRPTKATSRASFV